MDWNQLLAPVALAGSAFVATALFFAREQTGRVVAAVGDAIVSRLKSRAGNDGFNAGFTAGAKLYRFFRRLTGSKYIGRVLIFLCANGGASPQIGRAQRVKMTIGWHEREDGDAVEHADPEALYEEEFQVDDHYIGLLIRLRREKILEVVTAELPPAALIAALYRREGVVYAQWFLLEVDPTADTTTYASVASYKRRFTPDEADDLRIQMERIRSIYRFGNDPGTAFEMPRLK